MAFVVLLAIMGIRLLPLAVTISGLLFLSFSVPDLVIARRCWQDGCLGVLGLLMVWAVCEVTQNHRSWGWYAALVVSGSFAVLVKESGVFVYGECLLFVFMHLAQRKEWRTLGKLLLAALIGAGSCLCCLVVAAGGWAALLAALQHERVGFTQNSYGAEYQSGPWLDFIRGFWIFNPLSTGFGLLAVGLALIPRPRLRRILPHLSPVHVSFLRLFCWMTALLLAAILLAGAAQNFRYIAPVFGPIYFLGGFGLWALLQFARRFLREIPYRLFFGSLILVAIGSAVASYRDFERVYVEQGRPDLAIKLVLDSHR
jgi:hypothetical protein